MGNFAQSVFSSPAWKRYSAALGLALGLSLGLTAFAANPALFAGVTRLETAPGTGMNTQVLKFEADLPFQYQVSVLGPDQLRLRLYNARVSSRLADASGRLELSGGAIESAYLQPESGQGYQEIVLNGKGLGRYTLQVSGATELKSPAPATLQAAARPAKKNDKPVVVFPSRSPATGNDAGMEAVAMAGVDDAPEPRIDINSRPGGLKNVSITAASSSAPSQATETAGSSGVRVVEMSAIPSQTSRGPSIASVKNTTRGMAESTVNVERSPAGGMPMGFVMGSIPKDLKQGMQPAVLTPAQAAPSAEANTPVPPEFGPALEEAQPFGPEEATTEAPPEPDYQLLIPIPRYHGGAAPIKAVTLDDQGRAISLRPKNDRSVMEVEWGEPAGGFNTLFQADGPDASPDQRMGRALSLYKSGNYPAALDEIQQALTADGKNADLYAALGEVHLKLQHPVEAEKAYERAARLNPGKYDKRFAEVLVLGGKRTDAITYLKNAFKQSPQQATLAYMLGTLHEEQGDTQSALAYLQQAARLQPGSADIQYNLGLAYELTGDRQQAATHYQKALALNPKAGDVKQALDRVKH